MLIGVLHPGAMGSAVAACLEAVGHEVVWSSENRSQATRTRAAESGIRDVGPRAEIFAESLVVLSICPPANAQEVAREAIEARFGGVYVDCNAISPASTRCIEGEFTAAGLSFVDGGIVGPPPLSAGSTRLFLSGRSAEAVAQLFEGARLDAVVLDGPVGAASALKMAYAAWTKGSAALLLAIRTLASREGIERALLTEWDRSVAGLRQRSAGSRSTAAKAWRFVGEMEEIADTFGRAGLPDGFHRAAAEIYRRMSSFKDVGGTPELDEVIARISGPRSFS